MAVGVSSSALMLIVTVSVVEVLPSETSTWEVSDSQARSTGVVNGGCAVLAPVRVTLVPAPVWVHV